jgi:hypothetical protein
MVWEGRAKISGVMPGLVRLGDHAVPRRAGYAFTGAKGSPDLHMSFEVRDGRPECVEVTIKAKPDGRGIRTADLQIFNIDTLTVNVFSSLALSATEEPGGVTQFTPITTEQEFWPANKAIEEARRERRGSVTRTELEDVARVYREHFDQSPTQAVQLLLGYSARTAARRVEQARAAGLLPKTRSGVRKA